MPYITREDGERFVIPSYRDVMAVKQKSALKKEILLLSQSYGEYITLQRKATNQYEVAFSPDTGYLLGESIWQHFKRPMDMIYCEVIPNTTEAILVIVKSGSVYLDGSFLLESIPEELVIFLTQQNHFEIYTYGDVPISDTPEEGKFSFEPSSIRSFVRLEEPVFQKLPLLKMYQLQRVETVLHMYGIGVFPLRQLLMLLTAIVLIIFAWYYFHKESVEVPQAAPTINPFEPFYAALSTPSPTQIIQNMTNNINEFQTITGWAPVSITYESLEVSAQMQSRGSPVENLFAWAKDNRMNVTINPNGIYLSKRLALANRLRTQTIYPLNDVLAKIIDDIAEVYPGNHVSLSAISNKSGYRSAVVTVTLINLSPIVLSLIAENLKDLPLMLQSMQVKLNTDGTYSGTLILLALGN